MLHHMIQACKYGMIFDIWLCTAFLYLWIFIKMYKKMLINLVFLKIVERLCHLGKCITKQPKQFVQDFYSIILEVAEPFPWISWPSPGRRDWPSGRPAWNESRWSWRRRPCSGPRCHRLPLSQSAPGCPHSGQPLEGCNTRSFSCMLWDQIFIIWS